MTTDFDTVLDAAQSWLDELDNYVIRYEPGMEAVRDRLEAALSRLRARRGVSVVTDDAGRIIQVETAQSQLRALRDTGDSVEPVHNALEADFYGVYNRREDGTAHWVADHDRLRDAIGHVVQRLRPRGLTRWVDKLTVYTP